MHIVSLWLRLAVLLILSVAMASPGIAEPATTPSGVIEGTVTDALTGEPVQGADVELYHPNYILHDSTSTDANGDYSFRYVPTGSYLLLTEADGYIVEVYDDFLCHPLQGCAIGPPYNQIPVTDGATTSGIDVALHPGARISGSVTAAATGAPVSVSLLIFDPVSQYSVNPFTSTPGEYTSGLIPAGTYYVQTESLEYRNELYDDVPCPLQTGCHWSEGVPIVLDWGEQVSGIDLALDRNGAISGTVKDSATGLPLHSIGIRIWRQGGSVHPTWTSTDETGAFLAEGLLDGTYFLATSNPGYSDELYGGLPCEPDCEPSAGMPIEVSLETTTSGIDFALDRLPGISGSIGGRVLHDDEPVPGTRVVIYDRSGGFQHDLFTDVEGNYVAEVAPFQTYFAVAEHDVFDDQLYAGSRCEEGCDPTTGTPILVHSSTGPLNIDFDLEYCTPTATSLCLTGDRFRVEATWEDFENVTGPASAEALTTDAGTFWFFDPGNVELVVKILDICDLPENRFWVFAAGLTNVGVELEITDELTGESVSYSNALGNPYETVLDTQAFDTCDAGSRADDGPAVPPQALAEETPVPTRLGGSPSEEIDFKGSCQPGAFTLCLQDRRFMAELTWQAPNGDGGPARAKRLTDETGYFWFGSADNVEVMVKVLDACGLPSFQNHWVFAAGLTNFEIDLRITDTQTGETRQYSNPQGGIFETVLDLDHFMTCP